MNRTYNPFVDNGLFVASYYLSEEKNEEVKISDIKMEDILNEKFLEKIAEIIADLLTIPLYDSMARVTFNNSSYTQGGKNTYKKNSILEDFRLLKKSVASDKVCTICDEKKVNINFVPNRKNLPGIIADTFFNSANNLRHIDICSHCLLLGMFSFLNVLKAKGYIIYESDNDYFLHNFTEEMQLIHSKMAFIKEETPMENLYRKTKEAIEHQEDYYIQQIRFANGQSVSYEVITVHNFYIRFFRRLMKENLLHEIQGYPFSIIVRGRDLLIAMANSVEPMDLSMNLLKLYAEEVLELNSIELVHKVAKKLLKLHDRDSLMKILKINDNFQKYSDFILEEQNKALDEENVGALYDTMDEYKELANLNSRKLMMAILSLPEYHTSKK
jgi:ribosomal protein L7Ae-like RNA K-turn-binding protein